MSKEHVVILGCGYTGRRVAARLANTAVSVIATGRTPPNLTIPGVTPVRFDAAFDRDLSFIPQGARIIYSIPTLDPDPVAELARLLIDRRPARIVYVSTTSVYGDIRDVSHNTPPAPRDSRAEARLQAERALASGPWSTLILRPAAIYGPDRGVHVSMAEGSFRLAGDGSRFVSRIHVEDLAALCEAALFSDLTGAWPVADQHPCTSLEIAEFCSTLLAIPMPPSANASTLHHTRQADRRVDGSAIRQALGVDLLYPTYREGISASIQG